MRDSRIARAALLAVLVAGLVLGGSAWAKKPTPPPPPPDVGFRYTAHFLPTVEGETLRPHGMNNHGDVVGTSSVLGSFVYYYATGTMHDLCEFIDPSDIYDEATNNLTGWYVDVAWSAWDINDSGQIIGQGYYFVNGEHGDPVVFRFNPPASGELYGTMDRIDGAEIGSTQTSAEAINNNGDVAGMVYIPGPPPAYFNAFLWTEADGCQLLGRLHDSVDTKPYAMNDSRQITGRAWHYPWRYTPGEGIVDLGCLEPDPKTGGIYPGRSHDINEAGQIVGWSEIYAPGRASDWHAYIYTDGIGMEDLGTLYGERGDDSEARKMNDDGYVVGWSDTPDGSTHFIWHRDFGMVDLGQLIDGYDQLPDFDYVDMANSDNAGLPGVICTDPDGDLVHTGCFLLIPYDTSGQ